MKIKLFYSVIFAVLCFNSYSNDELKQLEQLANLQKAAKGVDVNLAAVKAREEAAAKGTDDDPYKEVAFDKVLDDMYPLTPDQIIEMRDRYEDTQRASVATIHPPRPTVTSQFVKLSPGSTPPVIRLAEGFVSTLVFLDSTGAPWPITSYNIGDPISFNLQWNKVDNVIAIQAKTMYKSGNMVVRLENLDTPVVVTLLTGQKQVDYRRELRIQGHGPKANSYTGDLYPDKENSVLLGVLDGVPPLGSSDIDSSDSSVVAWRLGGRMFIRTRNKILSPAWVSSVKSADGMNAYEMQFSSTILLSIKGKVETIYLKG